MEKGDATILHECSREITWATAPVGWGFKGILWICVDGVVVADLTEDKIKGDFKPLLKDLRDCIATAKRLQGL